MRVALYDEGWAPKELLCLIKSISSRGPQTSLQSVRGAPDNETRPVASPKCGREPDASPVPQGLMWARRSQREAREKGSGRCLSATHVTFLPFLRRANLPTSPPLLPRRKPPPSSPPHSNGFRCFLRENRLPSGRRWCVCRAVVVWGTGVAGNLTLPHRTFPVRKVFDRSLERRCFLSFGSSVIWFSSSLVYLTRRHGRSRDDSRNDGGGGSPQRR